MKRFSLLALSALIALPLSVLAEMDARTIMQTVKDQDDGNNAVMNMTLVLIDADGDKRERHLRSFRRDAPDNPEDSQAIMFFLEPANVRNTGFLTYDYDDASKDDDQWLYLPALKKVKRIAATDKSASFMGSDFTYADLSTPSLDDYDYELMKESEIDGQKVWQILSTPRTEKEIERTGYTKSVVFVRQDNFTVVRAVSWLKTGNRVKFMEVKSMEKIDGIWTPLEVVMTTKKGKKTEHTTVLYSREVKYNQPMDDALFTQQRLESGL